MTPRGSGSGSSCVRSSGSLMRTIRHTTPKITLDLYAQAVSADQLEAHKKVVQMMLPTRFQEQLKERSATATA